MPEPADCGLAAQWTDWGVLGLLWPLLSMPKPPVVDGPAVGRGMMIGLLTVVVVISAAAGGVMASESASEEEEGDQAMVVTPSFCVNGELLQLLLLPLLLSTLLCCW